MAIKVDKDLCSGCEACVSTCPVECLEMKGGKANYKGDGCTDCGACTGVCATQALNL